MKINKALEAAVLAEEGLRDLWRDAGGEFHGPKVETGTMPESKLLPFLRRMTDENKRLRGEMKAAFHELGGIGAESSKEFHRIGIDSARGILDRALNAK